VLRYLPLILSLVLTVYCAVDAIQTEDSSVRNLPKTAWVILILVFPIIGPISWLVAGRPERQGGPLSTQRRRRQDHQRERDARRPRGPDDDPDFLKGL
jgi:hypothetical protein